MKMCLLYNGLFLCRRAAGHSIFIKLDALQIHGERYLHQLPKRAVLPELPILHTASRCSFVPPTEAQWSVHDKWEEARPIGTMDLLIFTYCRQEQCNSSNAKRTGKRQQNLIFEQRPASDIERNKRFHIAAGGK